MPLILRGLSKVGERLPSQLLLLRLDIDVLFLPQLFNVLELLPVEGEPLLELLFCDTLLLGDIANGRGRRFASSFFHFIRRFWNQILMCLSVKFNIAASSIRRGLEIYLLKWNSFSNSSNWPLVYAVLVLLFSSSTENWAPVKSNW